jgi:hypothetical protein
MVKVEQPDDEDDQGEEDIEEVEDNYEVAEESYFDEADDETFANIATDTEDHDREETAGKKIKSNEQQP